MPSTTIRRIAYTLMLTAIGVCPPVLAASATNASVARQSCTSAGEAWVITLKQGGSVVIAPGACEPASIGTYSVIRYSDLAVGDSSGGIIVERDGSLNGARVTNHADGSLTLHVETLTAGSGNYRNTARFVLPKAGGVHIVPSPAPQ